MSTQSQTQDTVSSSLPQQGQEGKSFGSKIGDCWRSMCSCFGSRDEEEVEEVRPRKALVISGPTNFRREELNIAGLTPEQERFIREKQARDAEKLYAHLQPLASSPSGTFAERPPSTYNHQPNFPTFEQFTKTRSAASPHSSRMDRVVAHGRKLSDTFKHSLGSPGSGGGGYHAVGSREGSESVEMRALVGDEGSLRPGVGEAGKMSEDSFSRTTMTEESSADRDLDAKKGIEAKL